MRRIQSGCSGCGRSVPRKTKDEGEILGSQRVYKKTSANSVLTLYLGSRDLTSRNGKVEPLRGIIFIDPKYLYSQKVYGQLTLTFRYGREDEEVMGLKFCNEAVIALKQIWPRVNYDEDLVTPLQQALLDRLGAGSHPFTLEIGMLAPPSVQLVPAKKYNGAPIGTSYDIRVFMNDLNDDKFQRRTTVKLGIRVVHRIPTDLVAIEETNPTYTSVPKAIRLRLSPKQLKFHHLYKNHHQTSKDSTQSSGSNDGGLEGHNEIGASGCTESNNHQPHNPAMPSSTKARPTSIMPDCSFKRTTEEAAQPNDINGSSATVSSTSLANATKGPEGCVNKPFLWTEGRVSLKASLNKSAYKHEEPIIVSIDIRNNSRKLIRKMRIFAVQHVDVCMFSNGKFKNVVADINENRQIKSSEHFLQTYEMIPIKGPTKNWIAVEGTFTNSQSLDSSDPNSNYKIASSAHRGLQSGDERNVFAIYVSYYVKVKLTLSGMGGEVSLKLPFILGHVEDDDTNSEYEALDHYKNKASSSISQTSPSDNTITHHKENIIEEELHEEADSISLINDEQTSKKHIQLDEEKLKQEQHLLQRYKLKRESYSRSCEDIETLSRNEQCTISSVKALVHRQASDTNDCGQ